MISIYVSVFSTDGKINIGLAKTLLGIKKYRTKISFDCGNSIENAINRSIRKFIIESVSGRYDYFLLISSEIEVSDEVFDMSSLRKDAVSPLLFSVVDSKPLALVLDRTSNPFLGDYEQSGMINKESLIECDEVGINCIMIKSDAVKKLKLPISVRSDEIINENLGLCEAIKKAGYRIFVDMTKICPKSCRIDSKSLNDLLIKPNRIN